MLGTETFFIVPSMGYILRPCKTSLLMQLIFFDGSARPHLLPFTFTRPVAQLRIGILTIAEKWQKHLSISEVSFHTQDYLSGKFPLQESSDALWINGALCPNAELLSQIGDLKTGQALVQGGEILAARAPGQREMPAYADLQPQDCTATDYTMVDRPWKIFSQNGIELQRDYELLTQGRESAPLSATNTLLGDQIFAEAGVQVEAATLNSTTGPIYLGKNSVVMEGSVVRGGFALGEHSQLKLMAKIYGPTTIGPHSKVGGEVSNSVIQGYSNKGHDGFLGNSVIGEWCNLGADTNVSNLKNNYAPVKLWSYVKNGFEKTGQQFCGLMMGDHSKCGINTMFNTGTVVGVSANIYGAGFPRNFIPSFSWGGAQGFSEYRFEKAMETAALVMQRRGIALDATEKAILKQVFDQTAASR